MQAVARRLPSGLQATALTPVGQANVSIFRPDSTSRISTLESTSLEQASRVFPELRIRCWNCRVPGIRLNSWPEARSKIDRVPSGWHLAKKWLSELKSPEQ